MKGAYLTPFHARSVLIDSFDLVGYRSRRGSAATPNGRRIFYLSSTSFKKSRITSHSSTPVRFSLILVSTDRPSPDNEEKTSNPVKHAKVCSLPSFPCREELMSDRNSSGSNTPFLSTMLNDARPASVSPTTPSAENGSSVPLPLPNSATNSHQDPARATGRMAS